MQYSENSGGEITVTVCILAALFKKKKSCSSVSVSCFAALVQTVLLKYLMKYGSSWCLRSKKALVSTLCLPIELELFCKCLAGVLAKVISLTLLLFKCRTCRACVCCFVPPHNIIAKDKVFLIGLFNDYTGLVKCSTGLNVPLLNKEKWFQIRDKGIWLALQL